MRFIYSLLALFALFLITPLKSQTPMAVLDFNCSSSRITLSDLLLGRSSAENRENCRQLQTMVQQALAADERVSLISSTVNPAIVAERELQKDEDFLAGYVVEQWEQTGAEYLLSGQVLAREQLLALEIHRVADRSTVATHTQSFKTGFWASAEDQQDLVAQGVHLLLTDFFRPKIPLVKGLAGNNKARRVLVAGGRSQGFRVHQELRVRINGQEVGTVVVEAVEGEFFSRCRVIRGGQEIARAIQQQQVVEVEIIRL